MQGWEYVSFSRFRPEFQQNSGGRLGAVGRGEAHVDAGGIKHGGREIRKPEVEELSQHWSSGPIQLYQGKMASGAQYAKKVLTEGGGAWIATEAKVAITEGLTDLEKAPRRCCFADILKCPGTHTM